VKIDLATSITIATTTAVDTLFSSSTALAGYMKNVTITEPEGDVDLQQLLGVDTNSFQNNEYDEKPYGAASLTGTLCLNSDELLETYACGASTAIGTTHARYQFGKGGRQQVAVLVNIEDATAAKEINFLFDDALMTRYGDVKIGGPDGHWEQDVKFICQPKNFYIEFKN
jgi:hypothetical protein